MTISWEITITRRLTDIYQTMSRQTITRQIPDLTGNKVRVSSLVWVCLSTLWRTGLRKFGLVGLELMPWMGGAAPTLQAAWRTLEGAPRNVRSAKDHLTIEGMKSSQVPPTLLNGGKGLMKMPTSSQTPKLAGVSRGNTIRGNRTERFWEGNLPLRGSLRGSLRGRVSEVLRGFQRFSEVLRKTLSETLSECHFPLRVAGRVAPNRVAP